MTASQIKAWSIQPRFFTFNDRRLFGILIEPTQAECQGVVLYFAPMAEEMNRCRWQAASLGRALAARGYACLILDPYGSGESTGRVIDATWQIWRDDAKQALGWLVQRHPGVPATLWGMRLGALLAADLAAQPDGPAMGAVQHLLLWQPVLDGAMFLNQYLRLRLASQLVQSGEAETTKSLRARLDAGEVLEVAGYPLTGVLATGMAAVQMASLSWPAQVRVDWLEIVPKPEQALALPARKLLDRLTAEGRSVQAQTVACPPIWQTYEREPAPALEAATLALMKLPG